MSYPKKRVNLLFKNREQVDTDLLLEKFDVYIEKEVELEQRNRKICR